MVPVGRSPYRVPACACSRPAAVTGNAVIIFAVGVMVAGWLVGAITELFIYRGESMILFEPADTAAQCWAASKEANPLSMIRCPWSSGARHSNTTSKVASCGKPNSVRTHALNSASPVQPGLTFSL